MELVYEKPDGIKRESRNRPNYYGNLIHYNGGTQITGAKMVFLLNGVGATE